MWKFEKQALQSRYEANINFFKTKMPSFYKNLEHVKFSKLTLSVNEKTQTWDVFDGNRSLYNGDAESAIAKEVEEFNRITAVGAPLKTILPVSKFDYSLPRFFHKHTNNTINMMNHDHITRTGHIMKKNLPLVVFTGATSGFHIESMLETREIDNVIIAETEPEAILLSMYITDWHKIIPKFTDQAKKKFSFILITDPNEQNIYKHIWNELITYIPVFPSLALFYNHLKKANYARIIDYIQAEFQVFINSWGYYDDEANQFNNAKLNLQNGVPALPKQLSPKTSKMALKMAYVVVGAGPSLNERIEWIKENRNNILLASAGTALSILKHNDITPDIQIEIESDYATALHIEHTVSEDYPLPLLIGAVQINPQVFEKAEKKILFYKDSTSLFDIFGKKGSTQLIGMTPTCTNSATGLGIQLGFKNIFFFGMDFGYKDKNLTHATGSVYLDEAAPAPLKNTNLVRRAYLTSPSVDGGHVVTEAIYNSARDRIEKLIEIYPQVNIYNCSTGAVIKGSTYIENKYSFEKLLFATESNRTEYIDSLYNDAYISTREEINAGIDSANQYLSELYMIIREAILPMKLTAEDMVYTLIKINTFIEKKYRQTKNSLYFIIRGSIWHYFNLGISVAYSTTEEDSVELHISIWKDRLLNFLDSSEKHFDWITHLKSDMSTDRWSMFRINQEVDDPYYEIEKNLLKN